MGNPAYGYPLGWGKQPSQQQRQQQSLQSTQSYTPQGAVTSTSNPATAVKQLQAICDELAQQQQQKQLQLQSQLYHEAVTAKANRTASPHPDGAAKEFPQEKTKATDAVSSSAAAEEKPHKKKAHYLSNAALPLPSKLELAADKVLEARGTVLPFDPSEFVSSPTYLLSPVTAFAESGLSSSGTARSNDASPSAATTTTEEATGEEGGGRLRRDSNISNRSDGPPTFGRERHYSIASSTANSIDSACTASTSDLLRQVAEVLEGEHGEKIMSADTKERELYELRTRFYDRIRDTHGHLSAASSRAASHRAQRQQPAHSPAHTQKEDASTSTSSFSSFLYKHTKQVTSSQKLPQQPPSQHHHHHHQAPSQEQQHSLSVTKGSFDERPLSSASSAFSSPLTSSPPTPSTPSEPPAYANLFPSAAKPSSNLPPLDLSKIRPNVALPGHTGTGGQGEESDSHMLPTPTSPLLQFDSNILDQLDAIMEEQQRVLQALGVPGFFVTREPKMVERQRVVVEVMRGVGHHSFVRSS